MIRPRRFALPLALCAAALCLRADESNGSTGARKMVDAMVAALRYGDANEFRACFDPKMPGYRELAGRTAWLGDSIGVSNVAIVSDAGSDRARDIELDWRMEVQSRGGQISTSRHERVKLHAEIRDGHWRITAFAPFDLFAPPEDDAARRTIAEALQQLTAVSGDATAEIAGNDFRYPAGFFAAFDPEAPGFEALRSNVIGLLRQGDLESSFELVSNRGDDRRRTLVADWTLSLVHPVAQIAELRRHREVTLIVERRGAKWRIVSLDPPEFLAPEKPR